MQMVKKVLIILSIIWFAFVLFIPKRNLYYKLEQELALQDIKINEGKLNEGLFTFKIKNAVIYIKGIDLIHIEKVSFFSLIFYNRLEMQKVLLDKSLGNMMPISFDKIIFLHDIVSPEYISISAYGTFGKLKGKIDLLKHKIHIDFTEIIDSEIWKHQLKKGKKGLYYETSF